jgi:glycosyltransferase involved in cell wall biosynthesis
LSKTVSSDPGPSVLVDARGLNQSGIGRYLREILRHLLADDRFGRLVLAGYPGELDAFLRGAGRPAKADVIAFPHPFYSPAASLRWLALGAAGRLRADLAFFPHYDVPIGWYHPRQVVVVQDLIHFRVDSVFPAWKRALAAVVLAAAVRGATRLIVPSESTRRDLLDRHGEAADRLTVIPLGVHRDFATGPASPTIGGRDVSSWTPYLLCVGNRKPHKNLVVAVEEFARAAADRPELRLIIVGRSFGDVSVADRAQALGVGAAVIEIDEVTDAELRALYANAEALLFPSLYEGFGLPILEAMSFGLPVVASDRASVPEVVGEAGLIVNPDERGAMADAVGRLSREPGLRARLTEAGLRRAAELTWEAAAARTAEVLLEVAHTSTQARDGA